jgi:hypothetical protein
VRARAHAQACACACHMVVGSVVGSLCEISCTHSVLVIESLNLLLELL